MSELSLAGGASLPQAASETQNLLIFGAYPQKLLFRAINDKSLSRKLSLAQVLKRLKMLRFCGIERILNFLL